MNTLKDLNFQELKTSYQPSDFSFTTILEHSGSEGIIGQDSAIEALELGMLIQAEGYNVYIVGESNKERDQTIKNLIQQKAQTRQTPEDICYIYNFKNPEAPRCISLKAGEGKVFEADMTEFIQCILTELPLLLQSQDVNQRKQNIVDELDKLKEQLIMDLSEKAESMDILVKNTGGTLGFAPLNSNGEIYSKEEYNALAKVQKKQVEEKLAELYAYADQLTERIEAEEKKCAEYLRDLEEEVVLDYVGSMIKTLKEKYISYTFLRRYFNDIAEDILEHLELFEGEKEEDNKLKDIFPWAGGNQLQKMANKYRVNLLVAHTPDTGAPVIDDSSLGEICLTGKILLDAELNTMHTDFTHIRPGIFHKANGGYLLLHMQRLLESPNSWLAIKQLLKTGYIHINDAEEAGIALTNSMKPQPIKADIKVILMGSRELYEVLAAHDEDFKKLFKIKVIFEDEIENTKANIEALASHIAHLCKEEGLPDVTIDGLIKLVEYGIRRVGDVKKLPANIERFTDVVREASIYGKVPIDAEAIQKTINRRKRFYQKLEREIDNHIVQEIMLIQTAGEKIGQVNGLAVYTIDDYMFGRPVKITVTTYKGKQGIVDIEKAAELSGAIHTKGIHIITGFLGYEFAQKMPLSLSCNICFEQSYGQIDGDSASSAELYGILSSLSEIPIKQNIATTGSVNQFGEIQPIGGVNEKIEGFYKVCSMKGLKGDEGVMIPYQNKQDLMLSEEVIEAVKAGRFHIYTIRNIWEGIEIITGAEVAEVKQKVSAKLEAFNH